MVSNNMDIVDVYFQIKNEFPYLEFITENINIKTFKNEHTYHQFKLIRLYNQKFEHPIKTSIFLKENTTINKNEFNVLRKKIKLSFN